MQIALRIDHGGKLRRFCKPQGPVTIGRSVGQVKVDLDLREDTAVSRWHARVWYEEGEFWIEDAGSARGTWVDEVNIKGRGARRLGLETRIRVGTTTIRLESPEDAINTEPSSGARAAATSDRLPPAANTSDAVQEEEPHQSVPPLPPATESAGVTLIERLDAFGSGVVQGEARSSTLERQLDSLCEMALKFGGENDTRRLLQSAVEGAVGIISGAKRGALLMVERGSGHLMLKAQLPADYRPSERLARQAMERREGFAWIRSDVNQLSEFSDIGNGMCVPLLVRHEPIGALFVDAPPSTPPFTEADLRLLRAVAQLISMAVEQHRARALLGHQADLTNRLFSSRFPEKVRQALILDAAEGTLPIGTRRSLVTVLQSDIRGFTKLSEDLGPQRLSDLLNAYFPPLIDAVFAFGGSVERLVGDAIFAVFGSPAADSEQQEHAVRAALAMQQAVAEVSAFRARRKQSTCEIGIGIDCGEVLHGFIGNAESLDFTVIGDPANYSSRYCSGAKPGEILISPNVHSYVWKQVNSEPRTVLTKHEGEIEAHIVHGLRTSSTPPN